MQIVLGHQMSYHSSASDRNAKTASLGFMAVHEFVIDQSFGRRDVDESHVSVLMLHRVWLMTCDLVSAENWMRFRGPNGQGISSEKNLPVTWSANKNVAWRTSIPGKGWSSPIVFGEHVFLTTATEEGVSCRVLCVGRTDGRIVWNTEVHRQKPGPMRQQNSYATPTPVTDGERVYAVFYDGTAAAVDFPASRSGRVRKSNSSACMASAHPRCLRAASSSCRTTAAAGKKARLAGRRRGRMPSSCR